MATQIFVNLPVQDLERSKAFYAALGYSFNPQFTDENAACLVIDDNVFAMLLTEPFFSSFITKEVADAHASAEVIVALSADSRQAVDEQLAKATAAGGREPKDPIEMDFMYSRSFEDPDGHLWEYVWMDPSAAPEHQG